MKIRYGLLFCVALVAGCDYLVSPERDAHLTITGKVTDQKTGLPIVNASVVLGSLLGPTFAEQRTAADGSYTITHHLEHIATDDELAGSCTVWHNDRSREVSVTAAASGYIVSSADRFQCDDDGTQTINFQLTSL